MKPFRRPMSRRALVLSVAGALAVVFALGVGTAVAVEGDRVPRGVRVGDVAIGGLSVVDAERRLAERLADEAAAPVELVAADQELALDPTRAGLGIDAGATAREAAAAGPFDRVRALFGMQRSIEPVTTADRTALAAALATLAQGVDRPPREASIRYEALTPVSDQPLAGRALDVDAAAEAVVEAYPTTAPVDVPVEDVEAKTDADDVRTAIEKQALPAVAAPVDLTVEGKKVTVEPKVIAAALTFETDPAGALVPKLDGAALLAGIGGRSARVEQKPVDATFDTSSGRPVVVPSKPGRVLGAEGVAQAVRSVLTAPAPRSAPVSLVPGDARVTTEIAQGLGVKEVIGTYTSPFPCCAPRVTNIQRIAEIVDGYVLRPGDRFDLNGVVGPRDGARGFVPAPQILRGEFVDDVGGGVSQFATALFNAVFFSGLKDIEHKPHSYYISRYPPGREATVSFPKPDLIFENDSPNGVLVRTSFTGTSVTVTFWGTKRFDVRAIEGPRQRERDFETQFDTDGTCSSTSGGKGFDITVTRVMSAGGREVRRENFRTRYLPQPKIVCGPPPRAAAPSSPRPAPPPPPAPPPSPAPAPSG